MFLRFIHVVTCISTSVLFIAEYYSVVGISHILFIHSSIDEHLSWFHFWAIMNENAVNVSVQKNTLYDSTYRNV